jgi:ABC-type transport system involved in multi-copper enzyme maturation permease subunit
MPVALRWFLSLAILNPIAVRLVQNGSRRMRHMYIRSAYLAVLIVVLLWSLLINTQHGAMSYRDLAHAGALSFTWIAYLQIALICILAPVFMAGAIAQEANPKTWEVMLTTPLSAAQIVLGNLLGRLFFILALLVSSLPLFALTQYFGGVPGRSIFISYAIAACAALLVGTIAVALSVSRLVGQRAVFAFYISVISYLAITISIDYWLRMRGVGAGPAGSGVTWMTAVNPFLALNAVLDPAGYPRAEPDAGAGFLASWFLQAPVAAWCLGSALLSLGLLVVSTATVRLGGLAVLTGGGGEGGGSAVPWYRRIFGLGRAGAEHRPPRAVWHNPIAWREAAARNSTLGRMFARWSFIALGGLWGVGLVAFFHGGRMTPQDFQLALLATVLSELAVTTLVAINMSATAVSREREDGTLDLLLTTPLTPSNYLSGKLRGLIAYLLPMLAVPLGTLALAGIYVGLGGFDNPAGVMVMYTPVNVGVAPFAVPMVLPEAGLIAPLIVIPFMAFCVMIGLQWSLKSKGTISAVVATVGVVGVIAGIVGMCGWKAAEGIPFLGPALAALSPASAIYALVHPADAMERTVASTGELAGARLSLFVGAVIAVGVYLMFVYSIHAWMVRNFDVTVRKLAGVR